MANEDVPAASSATGTSSSDGGGKRQRSSSSASASASADPTGQQHQPQQQSALLLPDALVARVAAFVQQPDLSSLLQLSKASRRAVLPEIEALQLEWQGPQLFYSPPARALVRFLRRLPNLRVLSVNRSCPQEMLVREIGDGTVGAALRSLRLSMPRAGLFPVLCRHLEAGRLSLLKELQIGGGLFGVESSEALAKAVEARRGLSLPPLVRVDGGMGSVDFQRRIRGCCPRDVVAHLQANDEAQARELVGYLQEAQSIPALHSLYLRGGRAGEAAVEPFVFKAVAEGRARSLVALEIVQWAPGLGLLGSLGEAIREGHLPNLASLAIRFCDRGHNELNSADFGLLLQGLSASVTTKLRSFCLERVALVPDVVPLAGAMEEGGALSELEELKLVDCEDCSPLLEVLKALGRPVPCARTLRSLKVRGPKLFEQPSTFIEGMRKGVLPNLAHLELCASESGIGKNVVQQLADSLLELAAKGTPLPWDSDFTGCGVVVSVR